MSTSFRAEELASLLMTESRDFIFIHPPSTPENPTSFLEVNDYACQRLGFSREEMLSLGPLDLLCQEDHATVPEEAARLEDARNGRLKRQYDGGLADINNVPMARHNLLNGGYACGAIQTTRGCPLSCSFCSVTAFNGAHYRQRPVADVVREFQMISEKYVLVVDDNLVGARREHVARAKELFRAMAQAKLEKQWFAQASINFADDEELLALAAKAGCIGVFIGFESPTPEGLREIGKKFNLQKDRDFPASVRRIQRHGILVAGSFIIGLDHRRTGCGQAYSRDSQALRRGQSQRVVSDTPARHSPLGPDEIGEPHRPR